MTRRLSEFILPLYLLACLVVGGSAQGIVGNLALQLAAVGILAGLAVMPRARDAASLGALPWIGAAAVALAILSLFPLPPALWTQLPGRDLIASGFDLLDQPRPWLGWTLSREATLAALAPLIVPVALFALVVRVRHLRPGRLVVVLVVAMLLGLMLGFIQLRSGSDAWYLYRFSTVGQAAGFFANSNHMGTLLLVTIPFIVALADDQWRRRTDTSQRALILGLAAALGLVLVFAAVLNRSLAILLLGGPVALLSLAIPAWRTKAVRRALGAITLAALAVAVGVGASQGRFTMTSEQSSIATRSEIWSNSAEVIARFGGMGTGLGTFDRVYRLAEAGDPVDRTYVNHAHNDLLEIAVELGVPGLILVGLFLLWWGRRARDAWRSGDHQAFARAGSIASGAILLHSLVDFPLRTAAIAAMFALSLALMVRRVAPPRRDPNRAPLWDARHVVID